MRILERKIVFFSKGFTSMLRGIRDVLRGLRINGAAVRRLEAEMEDIRREWEEERMEIAGMWDKLSMWATRQAKRDKQVAKQAIDQAAEGGQLELVGPRAFDPAADAKTMSKAQLTEHKHELRRLAAAQKGARK